MIAYIFATFAACSLNSVRPPREEFKEDPQISGADNSVELEEPELVA